MNYEQKYKEALERAKNLRKDAIDMGENIRAKQCEVIFTELKESEYERIRKELITHCRNTRCVTEEGAERIAKWIAWLEKQGTSYTKRDVDDAFVEGMAFAKDELEKQGEKTINQPNFEIPFGAKDSELIEESYYIPKGYHAEISKDKVTIKKGEQEPIEFKWSADDKNKLLIIEQILDCANLLISSQELTEIKSWLKSLKQRIKGE